MSIKNRTEQVLCAIITKLNMRVRMIEIKAYYLKKNLIKLILIKLIFQISLHGKFI